MDGRKHQELLPSYYKKHPYNRSVVPTSFDRVFLPEVTKVESLHGGQ